MAKMNREEAEEYLTDKDEWVDSVSQKEAKEENEEKVKEVMKEGKIYGDPVAEIQW